MSELGTRYQAIVDRVARAAAAAGRDASAITLIVVSKNHPASLVLELLDLGVRDFGENRDQEAAPKAKEVASKSSIAPNWHFIGQLQSNKVKSVLDYASVLHSLDRRSLLTELVKRTSDRAKPLDVFIQVNLTDDPGRGGIDQEDLESFAAQVLEAPGLRLLGVMGVAGLGASPELEFERIASFSADIQKLAPEAKFVSMGMSNDFEQAISFGATHLRIGTAITGNRPI